MPHSLSHLILRPLFYDVSLVWISWGHSIPFAVTSAVNAQQKTPQAAFHLA
jgi:hypothetical protein